MEYTELKAKVEAALADYAKLVLDGDDKRLRGDEAKAFVISQTRYAAERLLELAKIIRANVHLGAFTKYGRIPGDVIDDMIAWGQPFARSLFSANLRDKITDLIEAHYGISFSSLRVYPAVTDKADGKIVYVAYNPDWIGCARGGDKDSFTLIKDGQHIFVVRSVWEANYTTRPDGRA